MKSDNVAARGPKEDENPELVGGFGESKMVLGRAGFSVEWLWDGSDSFTLREPAMLEMSKSITASPAEQSPVPHSTPVLLHSCTPASAATELC